MLRSTDEVARALHEALRSARPIAPPTEGDPQLTIAGAYGIQRAGRALREAEGERVVGRKVGLTSAAMQEMLGVDQPDFGYLTDAMVDASGAELDTRTLIAPRVEGEIAFRLAAPLAGAGLDVAAVLAATEAVAPAIEVIDSRVADWRIAIADTVADNASSARVVLGEFVALGDLDLAAVELELTVTDGAGGVETVQGRGDAVLGHPAAAIAWLAAALADYGERLEAGEVVIPGAMARALPVAAGGSVRATFGALGAVDATFAGAA